MGLGDVIGLFLTMLFVFLVWFVQLLLTGIVIGLGILLVLFLVGVL